MTREERLQHAAELFADAHERTVKAAFGDDLNEIRETIHTQVMRTRELQEAALACAERCGRTSA